MRKTFAPAVVVTFGAACGATPPGPPPTPPDNVVPASDAAPPVRTPTRTWSLMAMTPDSAQGCTAYEDFACPPPSEGTCNPPPPMRAPCAPDGAAGRILRDEAGACFVAAPTCKDLGCATTATDCPVYE